MPASSFQGSPVGDTEQPAVERNDLGSPHLASQDQKNGLGDIFGVLFTNEAPGHGQDGPLMPLDQRSKSVLIPVFPEEL